MKLDDLLLEFNQYADQSKAQLAGILEVISEGKVPEVGECQELEDTLQQLRGQYEAVRQGVLQDLTEEEVPQRGASVSELYTAWQNSQTAQMKAKMRHIEQTLSQFVAVQSLVAEYTRTLEPMQKEAQLLMAQINQGDVSNLEALVADSAGPELFLQALACEDISSAEGVALLKNLVYQYSYPFEVSIGLATNQYYIASQDGVQAVAGDKDILAEAMPTDTDTEVALASKPVEDTVADKIEDRQETDQADKRDSVDEIDEIDEVAEVAEVAETKHETDTEVAGGVLRKEDLVDKVTDILEEEISFQSVVKAKGLAVDESCFGDLSTEISPQESKSLSIKSSRKDRKNVQAAGLSPIVKHLLEYQFLTEEAVKCMQEEMINRIETKWHIPNIIQNTIEFSCRKGYLRKHILSPGGVFYTASPRFKNHEAVKTALQAMQEYKHIDVDRLEVLQDITPDDGAAMLSLAQLRVNLFQHISPERRIIASSVSLGSGFFACRLLINPMTLATGAFFSRYDAVDQWAEEIHEYITLTEEIQMFIFAALNQELATKFMDEVMKFEPGKLSPQQVFLFSFTDKKYYSYESGQEVTLVQLLEYRDSLREESIENASEAEEEPATPAPQETVVVEPEEIPQASIAIHSQQDHEANIFGFFNSGQFYCATAYARAIAQEDASWQECYDRIAYAVNDPMKHCNYSADSMFDLVPTGHRTFSDALLVAIGIRTFFSNQVRYDYNIKACFDAIKEYTVLSEYSSLGKVLYTLVNFKDSQKKGLDAYADYHAKSIAELENEVKNIQQEAQAFYDSIIMAWKQEKAKQRRFLEMKKLLFNPHSDMGECIKMVADNDKTHKELLTEFLSTNFVKEGHALTEDNIDSDMLWDYIMLYWEKAGDKVFIKIRTGLMSQLRSNIISITTKALQIMLRWCQLVDKFDGQKEDDGFVMYKKIRKSLLENIEEASQELKQGIEQDRATAEEKAGLSAIAYALSDIQHCIDGSYDANDKKYFYAPFLFTEDILLDENFYPVLEVYGTDVEKLLPAYRIMDHSHKELIPPETRLKDILEEKGDDCGTARLIVQYLKAMGQQIDVEAYYSDIESCKTYAKEAADLKKDQFIGELELAQSYGQFDNLNSSEDKKEKILQIVDEWYESACDNDNYGFFNRVMERYLEDIKEQSKTRVSDLLKQLTVFKDTTIKGITAEAKEKKVAKIQAAIDQQNYTVAEDLLAHADQLDDFFADGVEEDFLTDFLNDYNDYYKDVSRIQKSFATLVSAKTRNKEQRGGKRLADNWLPGGSSLGKNRLVGLLNGLGFKVDTNSVQEQGKSVRYESFNVKTLKATDGKREIYTHPIAAFGSGATEEGFRVVCLNGKYDAAALINLMIQLGNAKHTMILLDCALDKPERRILARKSKMELGDKLFVVIDRTVMMYMVKKYDETKAKRMLMSLIVPFGYYQPYVWESSNVMPPEIFMGRKHELERIESPTGANIVYGGRQLGKSALLKKAKADIDRDENGDRAVLVEIKGLDYEAAAKKIGHALYDEGVLTEDLEINNWEDLSRTIRTRLKSDDNRIQYLLLLLDEADVFIESCEAINYQPLDALKEIQSIGVGRFKFVIAGLRNIVRFKRDAALGSNSVLTHLEAMTVKPFKLAEARELMEVPLRYLGLKFPKENEALMTLILATTNYFPGLIQMYCAKLLTAMRNKDYAGYGEADTPIYEISEKHIKKVLADSEFTEQIREKFFITLKLDEDNYYFLIALIMAYLYHCNGYSEGYAAVDIKSAGKNLNIGKIASLDDDKLMAFMEELKELNVLRSTDERCYLFSKFAFFQMMGTRNEVEDSLMAYMED